MAMVQHGLLKDNPTTTKSVLRGAFCVFFMLKALHCIDFDKMPDDVRRFLMEFFIDLIELANK